jgi:hypothetical protein
MRVTPTGLAFVEQILDERLWGSSPMALVDVGAGGGIDRRWSVFGERLAAVGFDPLLAEVERLNESETRIDVRYEAAFVGCREYDSLFPPALRSDEVASPYTRPYGRSSAVAARRIQQQDPANAGSEPRRTRRFLTLDEYLAGSRLKPNFLEIGTGGSDFQVLLGAPTLLSDPDLLGVQVDAPYHGSVHDYANVFSNIDRHLRQRGFSLFDLEVCRYSRAALPARFAGGVPAHTISGQVHRGEAVYFRDLGDPRFAEMCGVPVTRERLVKLCCLLAVYGLDDCAADLLVSAPLLADLPQRERLLDALTPDVFGDTRYRDYVARFDADPAAWLAGGPMPASSSHAAASTPPVAASPTMPQASWAVQAVMAKNERLHETVRELRERVAGLKKVQGKLRRELEERGEKIKRMRQERVLEKKAGV